MYKRKYLLLIILIICFLAREKVYEYLIKLEDFTKIEDNIKSIKSDNENNLALELNNAYNYNFLTNYNLEYSKVLYRDIYNLKNEITIYKGKNNNIKENNLVINDLGLVGVVTKVNENSSVVRLLTNNKTNISVKIGDYYGILKYQDNKLVVEGINNKSNISIGDEVKTSDIAILPENILIGYVTNLSMDKYEIERVIELSSVVDFNSLKYVSVITSLRGKE
jgi:rod shape-determining protein MreC